MWSDGNDATNGKDGKDFNPRSREWSDARGRGGGAAEGISIHAPASGATGDEYLELLPESISIHAPASGATRKDLCCLQQGCDFNPRSREWSDRYIPVIVLLRHISIHAPASGATKPGRYLITFSGFQSTLPRVERQTQGQFLC